MFDRVVTSDRDRAVKGVLSGLRSLGVTPPKAITDAHTTQAAAMAALDDLITRGGDASLGAALEAALDGKKPDPAVLLAAVVVARPSVVDAQRMRLDGIVTEAVRGNVPAIIDTLSPIVDKAAADLDAAAQALGGVALDDAAAILSRGGDAAAHHAAAKAAEKVLTGVRSVVESLARARAYPRSTDPRDRHLILSPLPLDVYKKVSAQASPWQLRQAGASFALAGPQEYDARVSAVAAEWARDKDNRDNRLGPGVGQYPHAVSAVVTL